MSSNDPKLAADALLGLRAYERAPRRDPVSQKPEISRVRGATLRDHGGTGRPVVLIPSLINPPRILDLDAEVSLTGAIGTLGRHPMLVDWGKADERSDLSVAGHIEELLLPLLRNIGVPVTLIGYCLGGTMAIAAANLLEMEAVVTLAAPWRFSRYPEASHAALNQMWEHSKEAAKILGALPMEVLQAAFWSLDPERTVRKFAEFGRLGPSSDESRRFVELEEWANDGEPLPYPSASELVEDLFGKDLPGNKSWRIGGTVVSDDLAVPLLNLTAERDLIAPPQTVAAGHALGISSGHVGMIVGSARAHLHEALRNFFLEGRQ